MENTRTIEIGGKSVTFKATAATPRLYRGMFGRDLFVDLTRLLQASNTKKMDVSVLELFENIAYTMARQADPTVPDTPDQWLDGFEMFAIYDILPVILDLWNANSTSLDAKKKNPPDNPESQPLNS